MRHIALGSMGHVYEAKHVDDGPARATEPPAAEGSARRAIFGLAAPCAVFMIVATVWLFSR